MQTKEHMKLFVVEPRGSGGMIHYAYQMCNAFSGHISGVTLITAKNYEMENYPHSFPVIKLLNLWTQNDSTVAEKKPRFIMKLLRKPLYSVRRIARGVWYILEWIKLADFLIKAHPDIVQFGSIEFPFEALFLGYLKARGLILSQICHEFEPREKSDSLFIKFNNYLLKSVFNKFSIIFFHSESNRERFKIIYPDVNLDRSHIIPHGNSQIFPKSIDYLAIQASLKNRYQLHGTEAVILFFGNITASKGVPDLLNSFSRIYIKNKNAKLIIAGKPLKYINADSLINLANELGVQSATIFDLRYLSLEEVCPLIELADVVVYPYLTSTQSGSLQAAYAFGKPVVATKVGGLPDVVVDGQTGFLVSPNSPEELADAILKIINNPDLAKSMGAFAKHLSETRFSWTPITQKVVEVYKIFLSENKNHRLVDLKTSR
jgi:glycosyltransferase involved in cell wall biosynthesis